MSRINSKFSLLNRLPNDIILHVFQYSDFKDKTLGIMQINKECNKIINNDLHHFNEWVSWLFDHHARSLNITTWMNKADNISIEPLIRKINGKSYCIYINVSLGADFIEFIQTRPQYDQIFNDLNTKIGKACYSWIDEHKTELKAPSWNHLTFQKEIVEQWYKDRDINITSDLVGKLPTGLFEFVDSCSHAGSLIRSINFQKQGLAIIRFVSVSKAVRDKMKKVDCLKDKDIKTYAFEYAMGIGLQNYHKLPTLF